MQISCSSFPIDLFSLTVEFLARCRSKKCFIINDSKLFFLANK